MKTTKQLLSIATQNKELRIKEATSAALKTFKKKLGEGITKGDVVFSGHLVSGENGLEFFTQIKHNLLQEDIIRNTCSKVYVVSGDGGYDFLFFKVDLNNPIVNKKSWFSKWFKAIDKIC